MLALISGMAKRNPALVLSADAERDIDDIWDYLASEASISIADRTVRSIESKCRLLKEQPFIGPARDDLIAGMRSILVHPYVVFYRVSLTSVEIVRVLHQRRDTESIFADDVER